MRGIFHCLYKRLQRHDIDLFQSVGYLRPFDKRVGYDATWLKWLPAQSIICLSWKYLLNFRNINSLKQSGDSLRRMSVVWLILCNYHMFEKLLYILTPASQTNGSMSQFSVNQLTPITLSLFTEFLDIFDTSQILSYYRNLSVGFFQKVRWAWNY